MFRKKVSEGREEVGRHGVGREERNDIGFYKSLIYVFLPISFSPDVIFDATPSSVTPI